MQIYLLLTENCNLNCSICIRGRKTNNYIDPRFILQQRILNNFMGSQLILTGGEPTLHPQFAEIANTMSEKLEKIAVTTNGIKNDYFDKIKYERMHFQISVDGSEAAHDMIRGNGTYRKTMDTIVEMDRRGFQYSVATVINRENCETIDELIRQLEKLNNMKYWKLHYEMPFGTASNTKSMDAVEWNKFIEYVVSKARFRISATMLFPLELYDKNRERLLENTGNRIVNCGCVNQKVYVYPDFTVYPCTCLTDFPLGNLKTSSLEDILNNDKSRVFKEYCVNINSKCYSCDYKEFCNGGCIGMSYHKYGILGMGDCRCPKIGE